MYIFGGRTSSPESENYPNDLFAFDASTRQWTEIIRDQTYLYLNREPLYTVECAPCGRRSHSAVVVDDRNILVFGGYQETIGKHFNDLYEFDTVRIKWRRVNMLPGIGPQPRRRHSCHIVNGQMFILGGVGPIYFDSEPFVIPSLLERFNGNEVLYYIIDINIKEPKYNMYCLVLRLLFAMFISLYSSVLKKT